MGVVSVRFNKEEEKIIKKLSVQSMMRVKSLLLTKLHSINATETAIPNYLFNLIPNSKSTCNDHLKPKF